MPPTLLNCPATSEVDVDGMAVEVEPSHQYPVTFCCCVIDGSRGAVCQKDVWHGSANEAKECHWVPPCGKKGTYWHSSTLAEHLWRPNSGCQHSKAVMLHFSSGNGENGSPLIEQIFMREACSLLFITGKNVYLMVVIMLKNNVL